MKVTAVADFMTLSDSFDYESSTVGSKLNSYEYECNGGLHFEL
jgi:hypothetical protein